MRMRRTSKIPAETATRKSQPEEDKSYTAFRRCAFQRMVLIRNTCHWVDVLGLILVLLDTQCTQSPAQAAIQQSHSPAHIKSNKLKLSQKTCQSQYSLHWQWCKDKHKQRALVLVYLNKAGFDSPQSPSCSLSHSCAASKDSCRIGIGIDSVRHGYIANYPASGLCHPPKITPSARGNGSKIREVFSQAGTKRLKIQKV